MRPPVRLGSESAAVKAHPRRDTTSRGTGWRDSCSVLACWTEQNDVAATRVALTDHRASARPGL
eukprot:4128822-Prymnesium_polylepis.1